MPAPLVSIVIPCFRQAHFLAGAIESALGQSAGSIETIVVNDGSDDDTESVAKRFGQRIRYLWQPNAGLPCARNAGIQAAAGKYLLVLDADDLLHPEAVERLLRTMDGADRRLVAMGHACFRSHPDQDAGPASLPPAGPGVFPWVIVRPRPPHAFLSPRAAVLEVGLFRKGVDAAADWDMWLRLGLAGLEYAPCPFVGAYYRVTAGSMSHQNELMATASARVLLSFLEAVQHDEAFLRANGGALLRSAYAIRRRFRIHGLASPYVDKLDSMIRWLHLSGVRATEPLNVLIQDRLPYRWEQPFERACLAVCRIVRPTLYAELTGRVTSGSVSLVR